MVTNIVHLWSEKWTTCEVLGKAGKNLLMLFTEDKKSEAEPKLTHCEKSAT